MKQQMGRDQNSKKSTFAAHKLGSAPMNDGSVVVTFTCFYLLSSKFSVVQNVLILVSCYLFTFRLNYTKDLKNSRCLCSI